jgi:hypothetical protein
MGKVFWAKWPAPDLYEREPILSLLLVGVVISSSNHITRALRVMEPAGLGDLDQ